MRKVHSKLATLSWRLFSWVPIATGGSEVVIAIIEDDPQTALWAALVTGGWALAISCINKFYQKVELKLDGSIDELVDFIFERVKEYTQAYWLNLPLFFKGRYFQTLIFICRDFKAPKSTIRYTFTPDLRNVFVPLKIAVCHDLNDLKRIPGLEVYQNAGVTPWQILAESKKRRTYDCRIAILGNPGSGKTTILRHLAISYASNMQRRHHKKAPRLVPILLFLREVKDQILSGQAKDDLATLVESQAYIQQLKPQKGWFRTQLSRRNCLVLLDGLDEVANTQELRKVGKWIDKQISRYEGNCFVVTSRPFGYKESGISRISTVTSVQPLYFEESESFIKNWYLETERKSRALDRKDLGVVREAGVRSGDLIARIRNRPYLRRLSSNPLLLTMIAMVHSSGSSLPKSRAELYDAICKVLLSRQQDDKGIADTIGLDPEQKRLALQALAFKLMLHERKDFTIKFADDAIQNSLSFIFKEGDKVSTERFISNICHTTSLIVEMKTGGTYEFSHRSLQEYLASLEASFQKRMHILIENLEKPWWSETIRLFSAKNNSTEIIVRAINRRSINSVKLAYECLATSPAHLIEPRMRESLKMWSEKVLDHSDSRFGVYAAEIKLLQRTEEDYLQLIDRKTAVSPDLITCSEYQLFIDEMLQAEKHHQPDYWKASKFSSNHAKLEISGVRPNDALLFCEWLTERHLQEGLQYRLPTLTEENFAVERGLISESRNGTWCKQDDKWVVYGLDSSVDESLKLHIRRTIRKLINEAEHFYRKIHKKLHAVSLSQQAIVDGQSLQQALALDTCVDSFLDRPDKFFIDFEVCISITSTITLLAQAIESISIARNTGKHRKFEEARQYLQQALEKMKERGKEDLQSSLKIQNLITLFKEKIGSSNFDDRKYSRKIFVELLKFFKKTLVFILSEFSCRIRDLRFSASQVVDSDSFVNDFEPCLSTLKEVVFNFRLVYSDVDCQLKTSSVSYSELEIDRLSKHVGLAHLGNMSIVEEIDSVATQILERNAPEKRLNLVKKTYPLLLVASSFFYSASYLYSFDKDFAKSKKLSRKEREQKRNFYMRKREKVSRAFIYSIILERQINEGQPVWGTIRVVREIVDTTSV